MRKTDRAGFPPLQAQKVNRAFQRAGVDYLFIDKSGAILLGYPSTTQDVDLFVPKSEPNGRKILRALRLLGFTLSEDIRHAILTGKDFVQIKSGPFDLDLVHAPDGIPSYEIAKSRSLNYQGYPVASLKDIIASKRASNRAKDVVDLELLEEFRREFEKMNRSPIETAAAKALRKSAPKKHRN